MQAYSSEALECGPSRGRSTSRPAVQSPLAWHYSANSLQKLIHTSDRVIIANATAQPAFAGHCSVRHEPSNVISWLPFVGRRESGQGIATSIFEHFIQSVV